MSTEQTVAELQADVAFLLLRAGSAGRFSCSSGDRWTGMSSNALVCVAYGGEQHSMLSDRSDYAACVRTYARLPKHRRTPAVRDALKAAKAALLRNYPEYRTARSRAEAEAKWAAEYEARRPQWPKHKPRRRAA